jgi:beta-glucanase (GH16 family)
MLRSFLNRSLLAHAVVLLVFFVAPSFGGEAQPVGRDGKWSLVFEDGFEGKSLDRTKWRPNWLGPDDRSITKPVNTEEVSCYDPAQVLVKDGELQLRAEERPCSKWSYASGLVQTDRRFNFKFGYVEARIWMPGGAGLWPAFWTNGQSNPVDGEIDIVEASGTEAGRFHYHYRCGEKRCAPGGEVAIEGATKGWHVYAVEWSPGSIVWYYDGRKVYERREGVTASAHYIILNLGLRRDRGGYALPATMRTDYVRVWQRAGPLER